jgi:hypothetical protein
MPSFISNFTQRLRLPRMFFRKPTREEQIHGGPPLEFERPIPPAPWRGIAVVVTIVVIIATAVWELYARALGYAPTLNDNEDLWTKARRKVQPESIVIIGDSRAWFDVDLDEFQKGENDRSNWRWLALLFIRRWRTWRTTKIFTGQLFAASSRCCFSHPREPRRWNAPKKA